MSEAILAHEGQLTAVGKHENPCLSRVLLTHCAGPSTAVEVRNVPRVSTGAGELSRALRLRISTGEAGGLMETQKPKNREMEDNDGQTAVRKGRSWGQEWRE